VICSIEHGDAPWPFRDRLVERGHEDGVPDLMQGVVPRKKPSCRSSTGVSFRMAKEPP